MDNVIRCDFSLSFLSMAYEAILGGAGAAAAGAPLPLYPSFQQSTSSVSFGPRYAGDSALDAR